ncbi:hypothetical protein GA0074696_0695 [Micromonospora purpureochromogenes]|uniref:Uncharacterized protein n=1 Tax=Micromonospora purpureochromogenes TaxID=47872 RepID=A0A1C4UXI4_9ACTN|nr:hypothetical protein [Micromonospora purpureochromogenes]SCE76351.1 hypothetical protein GA0074696_0695 [Micromonospora purpureochromogenes]
MFGFIRGRNAALWPYRRKKVAPATGVPGATPPQGSAGSAEPAAGVGDRAGGAPAATGPRRLADPGADLAGEGRTVVTTARACRAGKADMTLSVMPLSHKYASESYRSLRHSSPAADTPERNRRTATPRTATPRTATASAIAARTAVGDRR